MKTVVLLMLSNIFMTFAWYAHLRNLNNRAWFIAALLSW
ncbi:MAG: DMT family protein, partial [Chlamydiae bacterium]|nr:DMT family protein [Chlamydiota bacterium]